MRRKVSHHKKTILFAAISSIVLFLLATFLFYKNADRSHVPTTLSHGKKVASSPLGVIKSVLSAKTFLLAQALPTSTPIPTPTVAPTLIPTPTAVPTPTPIVFAISGAVFNDYNRNGVKDGTDTFYKGATVTLSGSATGTTTTDANGNYSFGNLLLGTYTVTVTLPTGFVSTTATSKTFSNVILSQVANFGIVPVYDISGNIFIDTNGSTVKDAGEPNFPGISVMLSGATSATTTTDANGNYKFSNIYGGNDYTIAIQMPSSYRSTTPNSLNFTLNSAKVVNFGLKSTSTIQIGDICSGSTLDVMILFDHSDSMRLTDAATGNPKFSEAKKAANAFIDIVAQNLPTARIGLVQFAGSYNYPTDSQNKVLAPLTYNYASVKSAISNMTTQPYDLIKTGTCFDCGVNMTNNAMAASTKPNTQKLVIFMTDGVANQTIAQNGGDVAQSLAENNGMNEIMNGVNTQNIIYYTIGVGQGSGDEGINEPFLKQIANTNGGTYYNDPSMGDLTTIYDDLASSLIPTGKITGTVYEDLNFNGALDSGEAKLPNWPIQLSVGIPTPKTVLTDSSGNYSFTGLCTNPYTVTETVQPGWAPTTSTSISLAVTNGNTYSNINFGDKQRFSVAGNVFLDVNKNGLKDNGESNYNGSIGVTANTGTVATTNTGTYSIKNLLSGPLSASYTTLPSDYVLTYPLNGPPPSYSVNVGSPCNTNGALGALCGGGDITNLNFGISNLYPWFQSTCGDMRVDSGIQDRLYQGNLAIGTNAACTTPGVAFTGDSASSFGKGQISSTNWIVGGTQYPEVYNSSSAVASSYTSLSAKSTKTDSVLIDLGSICNLASCTLPANLPHGIYKANGDVVLNGYSFPSGQNYVFLINGSLTVAGNILVPVGSTAFFSARGNIIVNASVGSAASSTASGIEGIYTTDKSFIVNSNGACNDLRLNIAGSIIVNASSTGGSFQNNRDLCGGDTTYPTISFAQRLDFLFNVPSFIKSQNSYSWEAAP